MTDRIQNAAGALCRHGERLLIGRRRQGAHQGLWVVPEGDVFLYETSRAAVARELLDSSGVAATIGEIAYNVEIVDRGGGLHQHLVIYHAVAPNDEIEAGASFDQVRWATSADLALLARTSLMTQTTAALLVKAGWFVP